MIGKAEALYSLRPNSQWVLRGETLEWNDTVQTQPTEQEIQAELARLIALEPFKACKAQAKQLLAASDWAVLPDVGLKNAADFVHYRGILRGLVTQPQVTPDFPVEPTPVWE